MYWFTPREEEPKPQPFGKRAGEPPRKHTLAGLLDPAQFPPIRPRCFGCSQPVAIPELGRHILRCDRVALKDLMRFQEALAEFEVNPARAREIFKGWIRRIQRPELD